MSLGLLEPRGGKICGFNLCTSLARLKLIEEAAEILIHSLPSGVTPRLRAAGIIDTILLFYNLWPR